MSDNEPIYVNSLTPDDRLFLAYLAAWVVDNLEDSSRLAMDLHLRSKCLCEEYKGQEK